MNVDNLSGSLGRIYFPAKRPGLHKSQYLTGEDGGSPPHSKDCRRNKYVWCYLVYEQ
jgi:hypothetical protein